MKASETTVRLSAALLAVAMVVSGTAGIAQTEDAQETVSKVIEDEIVLREDSQFEEPPEGCKVPGGFPCSPPSQLSAS